MKMGLILPVVNPSLLCFKDYKTRKETVISKEKLIIFMCKMNPMIISSISKT